MSQAFIDAYVNKIGVAAKNYTNNTLNHELQNMRNTNKSRTMD